MSIWVIEETPKAICFVQCTPSSDYQAWEIISLMSDDYENSPVQLPTICSWGQYENCLGWWK